jgi:AAA+ superfamily predicted ATPase
MKLTPNQAIMFALFIEQSDDDCIRIKDLSRFLDCKNIKTICMLNDIDELEKRRLVRCCRSNNNVRYRVPFEVINAIKQNIVYEPRNTKNLSTNMLFEHIETLFNERDEKELTHEALITELCELIEENPKLDFSKQMFEYKKIIDHDSCFLLLFLFCHLFINENDDKVGYSDFESAFREKWRLRNIKSYLKDEKNDLFENKILEHAGDGSFGDREYFKITAVAKEKLFAELDVKINQSEKKKGLILHKDIVVKELFYNEREQKQIAQLSSLLNKENFKNVQENLAKNGMRKGFASIFYGAPGTGKTETVYQIAHATGRDILPVNISETKSCWFGESEKLIKEVFDKYRSFVKTNEIAPILLFNEADAVIGKRKDSTMGNVAQTENAIQNIILQEMETLDGIMIATTNLTQNLDKAFERRFLYKIEFDKPQREAKRKIWLSMLSALSEEEAAKLAGLYDFSGGQIENIVRKYTVETILNGTKPSFETINGFCKTEFLYKDDEKKNKIGFNRCAC